ncbi:hypothetical protein G9K00_000040 [Escherichia coli]|nr:hypothetical protein [Escherichia coli]
MHQVLILPRFARLTFALGLATAVFPVDAEYYFNPRFLSNDLAATTWFCIWLAQYYFVINRLSD